MYSMLITFAYASVLGLVQSLPPGSLNATSGGGKVPTWCGKAYRPQDPAIDPGGRIEAPVLSKSPLLDLKIQQRQSPYLASDRAGSFIVDTSLSYIHGRPYNLRSDDESPGQITLVSRDAFSNLTIGGISLTVTRLDTGAMIATGSARLNVSDNEISFSLNQFSPSLKPYAIEVRLKGGFSDYRARTDLLRLPDPTDGRKVTKIDNFYQALLVQEINSGSWVPFLPYSFYIASWAAEVPKLESFAMQGYNVLHVIPGYNFDWFDKVADEAERLGLWIMYDMRHTYRYEKQVRYEVERYKKRKNLLLWYTADEPDGNVDPTGLPKGIYDVIKEIDPYHPVSLCLNCANYFFEPYSAGADILLSDVYPIGTDTAFSTQFGTVCNETYGCCGCDNCQGQDDISNIGSRLDQMQLFQTQLGQTQKPIWAVPQAFGNGEHWSRIPTQAEEAAMTILSINHGAKGVIMWTWPTTDELAGITSRLSKTLAKDCAKWILGAKHLRLKVEGGFQGGGVDASAWIRAGDEMLISVVNTAWEAQRGAVTVQIPDTIMMTGYGGVYWGNGEKWSIPATGGILVRTDMPALGVDVFTIKFIGSLAAGGSTNNHNGTTLQSVATS